MGIATIFISFLLIQISVGFVRPLNAPFGIKSLSSGGIMPEEQQQQPPQEQKSPQITSLPERISFRKRIMNAIATEPFFKGVTSAVIDDPDVAIVTAKILSYSFWFFIILVALGTIGVDTKPLLSLFSVAGITLGFSAKDFIANTFAGVFVLLTRPFERGDLISVGSLKGKVLSIDIRYMRLESFQDLSEILVPLSMVYNQVITIHQHSKTQHSDSNS